jgi:peptidoglycan hydrolase-like protein with peptidoglycan-binding domain
MKKTLNLTKIPNTLILGSGLMIMAVFLMGAPASASAEALNRQLELGMSGSDVSTLQSYLAEDPTIYPQGLVTGYFGFLTKAAVANFQSANGLSSVGRVGPMTLPVLNAKIANNSGTGGGTTGSAPLIGGVGVSTNNNSAVVSWMTNENAKGQVYYSMNPLITYEHPNSVDVSGSIALTDSSYRTFQGVTLSGLQANTTYYYLIYSTDQQGNVSVTWPATFRTNN